MDSLAPDEIEKLVILSQFHSKRELSKMFRISEADVADIIRAYGYLIEE